MKINNYNEMNKLVIILFTFLSPTPVNRLHAAYNEAKYPEITISEIKGGTHVFWGDELLLFPLFFSLSNQDIEADIQKQPNILLITADDLGRQLSCYGDGIIQTPNIDNLARQGVLFTNGYVTQASCSSSRSSILTGVFPHSNGQIGLANHGFMITREDLDNIPAYLKKQGYQNGIIGKLHVSPAKAFPFDYEKKNVHETRDMELVVERAEEFIRSSGEKPFFLYLNYFDPHVPLLQEVNHRPREIVKIEDVYPFEFQGVDDSVHLQRIANYYSCVKRLDEGIGLLMNKLDELEVLDNTMIIFIGDHGAPFVRAKGACYESSVNIPYIISYPGKIKSNWRSDALVSTTDIFPTIIDLLGGAFSEDIQGESLLPILSENKRSVRDYLFTEFNYHGKLPSHFYPRRTIRDGRYKLIVNLAARYIPNGLTSIDGDNSFRLVQQPKYDHTWIKEVYNRLQSSPETEFFDLKKDPYEKNNLAGKTKYRKRIESMREQLEQWMVATKDPFFSEEFILKEIKTINEDK